MLSDVDEQLALGEGLDRVLVRQVCDRLHTTTHTPHSHANEHIGTLSFPIPITVNSRYKITLTDRAKSGLIAGVVL